MASANSSISLTSLDFDAYKEDLKSYLRSQSTFKDYDFEASNMSVLLDVLAYNTYQNAFYMNMIGNEMFLDSAQLRDSVVSHAKELNYVPRSFKSAEAELNISIFTSDTTKRNITIPRGTGFVARVGANTFLFTTAENQVLTSSNNVFTGLVTVYEGDYTTDSFGVSNVTNSRYTLSNKQIDVSSLKVVVIEDNGATVVEYTAASSLFDLDETSAVYFVQGGTNDKYEIVFGDGIIGRKPKTNSVILAEYRISSGSFPNGARLFRVAETIDNESNVSITTVSSATGGTVYETIESIKYNAPRAFTTQERAVTAEDYENLLKLSFPEINTVSAYGGEDANPPQYGRVFVSIDLKDIDGLPKSKEQQYAKFLKSRSTVSMDPIFISPEYVYVKVTSDIKYNINKTSINIEDMKTFVISAILDYSDEYLNKFGKIFRYSKFIKAIDAANENIISNETDIELVKYLSPALNANQSIEVNFKTKLAANLAKVPIVHQPQPGEFRTVKSSNFTYNGNRCSIEDNGDGDLHIVTLVGHRVIASYIGKVDYNTGKIQFNNFNISSYDGNYFKIYVRTDKKDIQSSKNVILNILETDVYINIEQVRE